MPCIYKERLIIYTQQSIKEIWKDIAQFPLSCKLENEFFALLGLKYFSLRSLAVVHSDHVFPLHHGSHAKIKKKIEIYENPLKVSSKNSPNNAKYSQMFCSLFFVVLLIFFLHLIHCLLNERYTKSIQYMGGCEWPKKVSKNTLNGHLKKYTIFIQ